MSKWGEDKEEHVKHLDKKGAKDIEYRSLLSTGSKAALKRGETWRKRVMRYVDNDKKRG